MGGRCGRSRPLLPEARAARGWAAPRPCSCLDFGFSPRVSGLKPVVAQAGR